jgi:hypothetical protein
LGTVSVLLATHTKNTCFQIQISKFFRGEIYAEKQALSAYEFQKVQKELILHVLV